VLEQLLQLGVEAVHRLGAHLERAQVGGAVPRGHGPAFKSDGMVTVWFVKEKSGEGLEKEMDMWKAARSDAIADCFKLAGGPVRTKAFADWCILSKRQRIKEARE
jgi:hypothetical protein